MHTKKLLAVTTLLMLGGYGLFLAASPQRASLNGVDLVAKNDNGNSGGSGGNNGNNGGGNGGDNGNANGGGNGGGGGNNGNNGGGNGGDNGNANGGGNGGGGGNNGNNGSGNNGDNGNANGRNSGGQTGGRAGVSGRGLRQHAAAIQQVLQQHGIHSPAFRTYTYSQRKVYPAGFASLQAEEAWGEDLHEISCSIFRYLQQLREARPRLRIDYVDWVVHQLAIALGEDPVEVKAALLGYPHQHSHTSELLQGISEVGCVRGADLSMKDNENFAEEHALHPHGSHETGSGFAIHDHSTETGVAFHVLSSGAIFRDYGVSDEKEMHLLIVRDDLRYFSHIHPEIDEEGSWRAPFVPEAGGTYWFYVDFVDAEINHYTIRFERTYEGNVGETGFVHDMTMKKRVGEYNVVLEESKYHDGVLFTFHINDDQGNAPFLEKYLGAVGHGILISTEGDFIHTHPSPVGDHLTLHLPRGLTGIYRLFTQFQVHGKVQTVEFDWMTEGTHNHH